VIGSKIMESDSVQGEIMSVDGSSVDIKVYIRQSYFMCRADSFFQKKVISSLNKNKCDGSAFKIRNVELFDSN